MPNHNPNRRSFIKATTTLGLTTPLLLPQLIRAQSPNEKVHLASVGVGGKGWSDSNGAAKYATMVAFADVNQSDVNRNKHGFGAAANKWPKATALQDWRVMFDKHARNIDAVTISTPDHMHAPITMTALKLGIACYTQKPLTRTVHEARQITQEAAKAKVATQMGNQHHSAFGYRYLVQFVREGRLGKIKEAHTWSNRPIWPQGIDRPAGSDKPPKGFNWDLWLGTAQPRPYKDNTYHPFKWRGWYDFGAGALGDMGCHIIDPVIWALELGPPNAVTYNGPTPKPETFPKEETLTYNFPGNKYTKDKTFTMKWYDGPRRPSTKGTDLPDNIKLPTNGSIFVGEKATLICAHTSTPKIYSGGELVKFQYPKMERIDHYGQWIDAVKTKKPTGSQFSYSGPMTETVLLGVVASRAGNGTLQWDSENLNITNNKNANKWLKEDYRKGWEVQGL